MSDSAKKEDSMKKVMADVPPDIYRRVKQYQLDEAGKGRRLRIGEAVSELLQKGLELASPPIDG